MTVLFVASIFLTAAAAGAAPAGCPASMTNLWELSEQAPGSYVDSAGGDTASCSSGVCPSFVNGVAESGQTFNGADIVNAPESQSFDWGPSQSFSVEFWVNTSSTNQQVFIGRHGLTNGYWWIGTDGTHATLDFNDTADDASITGTAAITDGQWHLIAVARDATANTLTLYVDGKPDGTAVTNAAFTGGFAGTTPLSIGYWTSQSPLYLNGSIDEIALYNGAISQAETQTDYNSGFTASSAGAEYCGPGGTISPASYDFGPVALSQSSTAQVFTVTNSGLVTLNIPASAAVINGTNAAVFAIQSDGCSGQTLAPSATCQISIVFSPTAAGSDSAQLSLSSNASSAMTSALNGAGGTGPAKPGLVSPTNGQSGLGSPVTFEWTASTGATDYKLYVSTNAGFANSTPIDVPASTQKHALPLAGAAGLAISAAAVGMSRRKKIALLIAALALAVGLAACGGGSGSSSPSSSSNNNNSSSNTSGDITKTVSGLSSGTTYYWKVTAVDSNGMTTDSNAGTFTTK